VVLLLVVAPLLLAACGSADDDDGDSMAFVAPNVIERADAVAQSKMLGLKAPAAVTCEQGTPQRCTDWLLTGEKAGGVAKQVAVLRDNGYTVTLDRCSPDGSVRMFCIVMAHRIEATPGWSIGTVGLVVDLDKSTYELRLGGANSVLSED
jgi:hypothetical protein